MKVLDGTHHNSCWGDQGNTLVELIAPLPHGKAIPTLHDFPATRNEAFPDGLPFDEWKDEGIVRTAIRRDRFALSTFAFGLNIDQQVFLGLESSHKNRDSFEAGPSITAEIRHGPSRASMGNGTAWAKTCN